MRKVIMMVTLSGDRTHYIPGQEAEFENEEAQRLVDAHFAKFADSEITNDEIVDTKKKTSK